MNALRRPDPLALIVEDDEKLATIFAQALRMASFKTQIIRDGQEANEKLKILSVRFSVSEAKPCNFGAPSMR